MTRMANRETSQSYVVRRLIRRRAGDGEHHRDGET